MVYRHWGSEMPGLGWPSPASRGGLRLHQTLAAAPRGSLNRESKKQFSTTRGVPIQFRSAKQLVPQPGNSTPGWFVQQLRWKKKTHLEEESSCQERVQEFTFSCQKTLRCGTHGPPPPPAHISHLHRWWLAEPLRMGSCRRKEASSKEKAREADF